jgi:hypothetical protein
MRPAHRTNQRTMSDPTIPQLPSAETAARKVPALATSAPAQSSLASTAAAFGGPGDPDTRASDGAAANDDSGGPRISVDAEDKRGGGKWAPEVRAQADPMDPGARSPPFGRRIRCLVLRIGHPPCKLTHHQTSYPAGGRRAAGGHRTDWAQELEENSARVARWEALRRAVRAPLAKSPSPRPN